jgi:hypothetical protein
VAAAAVAAEFPQSIVADVTALQVTAANKRTNRQVLKWKNTWLCLEDLRRHASIAEEGEFC